MNEKTKQRLFKMLIYILIGFAVAYFWHGMKQ
jgi:multisubunit Na+/H+ antiporter MnhB subunit